MEIKVTKVKSEKVLSGFNVPGNFLFKKKESYNFNKGFYNLLTFAEPNDKNFSKVFKEEYLDKMLYAFAHSKNKPCVLFFGGVKAADLEGLLEGGYKRVSFTAKSLAKDVELLNNTPCVFVGNNKNFEEVMTGLLEARKKFENEDIVNFLKVKDVVVYVSEPQDFNLKMIETCMAIGRSAKVTFVVSLKDKEKFASLYPDDFNIIDGNCPAKLVWKGTEAKEI